MRARIFITLLAPLLGLPDLASGQEPSFYEPMVGNGQQQLVKLAKEQEELFVRRGVRFNDPELLDIVNRVGETIFPVVLDEYINFRVYLIRDPSPIAFSLADGQIYIHTGLLARLGDEAQLAAVLAHEAHHVAAHHHILANSARRKKANIAGGIAVALNRGESGQSFPSEFGDQYSTTSYASLIGGNPQSVFSSNQEIEADAASIGLIGRAGHPPAASLQAIASIRQDPELSTPSPLASFTSYDSLTERQGILQE